MHTPSTQPQAFLSVSADGSAGGAVETAEAVGAMEATVGPDTEAEAAGTVRVLM